MRHALLIRIAATLALITFLGHLVGTLVPVPTEQTAMHATIASMKATMVPMPAGEARSYMQILDGNNFATCLLLLFCAVQLFAVAGLPVSPAKRRTLLVTSLAMSGFAILSAIFFFPVPAVLTGVAAVLCLWAWRA